MASSRTASLAPSPVTLRAALRGRRPTDGVPSPCIGVCRVDPVRQTCEGCWRTLDEIGAWAFADDAEKRQIWDALEARQRAAGLLA